MTATIADVVIDRLGARCFGRRLPCAIGRAGRTSAKREGDGASLIGRFAFEAVYFRPDRTPRPKTALATIPIRPFDGWSDDPADPRYNAPVRLPSGFGAENLRRADPLYDLVLVTDANRHPTIPGAGSALFVHCWRRPRFPTAGCVAFDRRDLIWLIEKLTPRSRLLLQP